MYGLTIYNSHFCDLRFAKQKGIKFGIHQNLKLFCFEDIIKKVETQLTELANHILGKRLLCKIH
jgi:hypothetical protein